jgi:phage tail-like protein
MSGAAMRSAQVKKLLPEVFQTASLEGTPLMALLEAMADLLTPSIDALDVLETYFNPYQCPEHFVPFLAMWVDMDVLLEQSTLGRRIVSAALPTGSGRMRALIAHAAYLSKWRGTTTGLLAFLRLATGVDDFILVENPDGRLFHVSLTIPARLRPFSELINAIVAREKPAYVTCEFAFADPPSAI